MFKRSIVKISTFIMLMLSMAFIFVACAKMEFKVDFIVDDAVYDTINTNGEEVIKMPNDPEKEGYVFDGWYWDKDSWKKPFSANSLLDAPLSSNMSVYAKWMAPDQVKGVEAEFEGFEQITESEYSLKVSNSTTQLSLGSLVTINSSSSWTLSTDIYGNQTIASKTATLNVGDNTYYALVTAENGVSQLYTLKIRRKPVYNVIFDTAGGTSVENQKVEEDGLAEAPQSTREGYDFSAWDYDFTTPITENKLIVASWTAKEYTITYDAAGGDIENTTASVIYDSEFTLEVPTRRGYEFLGWYIDGVKVETNIWQIASDVTVLAQWNICEYTISYDLNGGSVATGNPDVYTVESENIILNNPVRDGYNFIGWTGTDISQPTMYVIIYLGSIGNKEYVANWDYDGYDITYHLDGGENHINNPGVYNIDTASIYLENASRTGYIFGGWYTSNTFSEDTRITVIAKGSTGDKDLYAKWTPVTYTVKFNKNSSSATGTMGDQIFEYNITQNLTSNLFERVGYTFVGWNTNADGTGTSYNNAEEIINLTATQSDVINLYAVWEANTYTVTFDKNGSTGGTDSVTVTFDSAMPEATAPDAYIGYTFNGYFDANGNQYYDSTMSGVKVWDKAENVTLYANWVANTVTVSFDVQNGTGGTSSINAIFGSAMPAATAPNRTGYTFTGYFAAPNGQGTQYYNENMESVHNWDCAVESILYAAWEANSYEVSFDANGGSVQQSAVTATYGEEMPEITAVPTRDAYIFVGYYDALTGGTKYYNADLTSANAWANASDKTLYARWQGVPYYVSFDANSGTGTMATQEFEYGVSEYLNDNEFTRTGYTFAGWNTEADGTGTAYLNTASVISLTNVSGETITLYAQWTAKTVTARLYDLSTPDVSYTVSFDLNGASGTAPAAQTVTETVGLTYPTNPTRSGYLFGGWYTTSACTGSAYDFTADITSDVTLYAKWVSYSGYGTLSVGGNSGTITFPARSTSNYRYYAFVPLVSGSVTIYSSSSSDTYGYLFNSAKTQIAYDDDSGSGVNFQMTYAVTAGQLYYVVACAYSSSTSCTGTIYISGTSTPSAGGVASDLLIGTEQLTYDQNFTLDVPTMTGYTFVGWYDGEGGTGTQYTDAAGASVKAWDKEVDTILYARWEATESTLTFDKQDGTGGTDSVTVTYGSAMPEATAPTKVGYTFMGYYTAISGGIKYYNADMTSATECDLVEDITLYARWSANTYTITFDKQGGSGTSSATVTYDSILPTVAKPTKTGYTFLGYYDAAVDGNQYYDENMGSTITWARTEDITLYAHWQVNTYVVTFNTNQGSGAQTAVTATYGEEMPEITIAPTRDGYIFIGYYDALTGGTKYYNADLTSANAWANASDKTLYARWQGVPYYVSFDANNGTGTMATQEFEYGVSEYLNDNEFTRTGYTFAGWNTEADGTGTAYLNAASVNNLTNVSGETVTLYAQWTAKTVTATLYDLSTPDASYTVSFDLNGASGTAPAAQTVTETVGLTYPTIPTRSGYVFGGWYATSACTGSAYDFTADVTSNITLYAKWVSHSGSGVVYADGSVSAVYITSTEYTYLAFVPLVTGTVTYSVINWNSHNIDLCNASKTSINWTNSASGTATLTAGTLYYMRYKSVSGSQNLTFRLTGISPSAGGVADGIIIVTEQLTYDQSFTLDVPTMTGYTFVGWYDGEGGTGTQYTDATGASVKAWDKEVDTTLYAKWQATESTLTFDKQDGMGGTDSVTVTYGSAMPEATAPTKVGYTFMGYYTAISGGTKYYNADMTSATECDLVEDATLYARWSANTYTITFDKQGGNGTSSATVTYDSILPTVAKPTKTGYTFLGYYDAAVDGNQYYDENMGSTTTWTRTEDITLYAHWQVNTYVVSFNTNQGTGAQSSVTATYGEEMPEITIAPTRDGYIFIGYYDALTGGTKYYNADLTSANAWANTSDQTLYARWQGVPYYVSFDANNGTGTMATQEFEYGVSEYLNDNEFTRTGYTFAGWNTEADGTGTAYLNAASVNNLTNVSGETITLYAQWTAKTVTATLYDLSTYDASYTVSFNLNGASGTAPAAQTVTKTVGLTYPAIPTRSGYLFGGWYTTSACTGSAYDFTAEVTSNITLYAKWVSYSGYGTLSVGGNSGTITFPARSTSNYRYYAFVPLVSGSVTIYSSSSSDTYGYLFNSAKTQLMYNDDGGSGTNFQMIYSVTAGQLYYVVACAYSTSTSCTGTIYISGTSTPSAGGVADGIIIVNEQLTYDQSFTFDVPTKTGYNFVGWYDGEGGTGTQYTDETGASVKAWDKEVDTTLYAKWEAIEYSIIYELNGGVNNDSNPLVYNIETDTITLLSPTKAGYTFIGWTSDAVADPTKNLVISTGSIGDITVTANWIDYDLNDITYNSSVKDFSILNELTAEYFGAQCLDTDGNAVTITASFVTAPVAGETTSVLLVATSGDKTTQTTIEDVKIYGTPTINIGKTTIKSTDAITAATFEATAADSFGNALSVSVSLVEGDVTRGGYRTYEFVAVDCVDNELSSNAVIMVYSADDIDFAVNEVVGINVGSIGAEFGAVANDSFADPCEIEFEVVSGNINTAGTTVDAVFTATDVVGNISTLAVNNVKVYGTPVATMNVVEVTDSTSASDIYTVRDSFGVVLDATITFATAPIAGQNVAIQIVAVDAIGNQLNTEYVLPVKCTNHAIGANCTCEICGKTVHEEGEDCTCRICGSSFHSLDANCVCQVCGVTHHDLDENCVCRVCGNEYHINNGAGVCANCGFVMDTADVWNGTIASSYARGSGTSSNPYIIETGAQLAYLASRVNAGTSYAGCYFKLDNDIDLNNINWTSIGIGATCGWAYDSSWTNYFSGTFDGNGHVISNLRQTATTYGRTGLFGLVYNGSISKLSIESAQINATNTYEYAVAGILIGSCSGTSISECSVNGSLTIAHNGTTGGASAIGGMIGHISSGSITNCISDVNITASNASSAFNAYVGGFVGELRGSTTISMCIFEGSISATTPGDAAYVGGIVGCTSSTSSTTITKCITVGTLSASGSSAYADAVYKYWTSSITVTSCYYNATFIKNSTTTTTSTYGTNTSLSNLTSESWLTSTLGWDFDSVWTFVEGNDYPSLVVFN